MKGGLKTAVRCDAPDVENALAEFIEDTFKSAWYIKAQMR